MAQPVVLCRSGHDLSGLRLVAFLDREWRLRLKRRQVEAAALTSSYIKPGRLYDKALHLNGHTLGNSSITIPNTSNVSGKPTFT